MKRIISAILPKSQNKTDDVLSSAGMEEMINWLSSPHVQEEERVNEIVADFLDKHATVDARKRKIRLKGTGPLTIRKTCRHIVRKFKEDERLVLVSIFEWLLCNAPCPPGEDEDKIQDLITKWVYDEE